MRILSKLHVPRGEMAVQTRDPESLLHKNRSGLGHMETVVPPLNGRVENLTGAILNSVSPPP